MYSKRLAECFPLMRRMFECENKHCFYYETLLKVSECEWRDHFTSGYPEVLPYCPSCGDKLTEYENNEV